MNTKSRSLSIEEALDVAGGTGPVRLEMKYDRFVQPVSVIAVGPAVTAALLYSPPNPPGRD